MTAMITAGAASSSADLLTDLKAGYLLGASPRWQTIAQLFGVVAGVLVCVPIYSIIVRTPPFDPNATAKQADSRMATARRMLSMLPCPTQRRRKKKRRALMLPKVIFLAMNSRPLPWLCG